MNIHFFKYQGTGNDFVILDNRAGDYHQLTRDQVAILCHRRYGIGADGLMLLNSHEQYDFEMKYYNADGGESSMCGNGGRCLVKFAWDLGMKLEKFQFLAVDGPHEAKVAANGQVELKMIDVPGITRYQNDFIVQTGSPHYVKEVPSVDAIDVFETGQSIRNSPDFIAAGINVNFLEMQSNGKIKVRTYERGVEDETYSCGTGVTAAALVAARDNKHVTTLQVETKGGELEVKFQPGAVHGFEDIWLCGPALQVFTGNIIV